MANQFLVHLPDGTRYGPIDRATLEAWHGEGRLPPDTLVWPEGAPEWISIEAVLNPGPAPEAAAAAASPAAPAPRSTPPARGPGSTRASASARAAGSGSARPVAPAAPAEDRPETLPSLSRPAAQVHGRPRGAAAKRTVVLVGVGVAIVVAVLAVVFVLLRPALARRQQIAEVQRWAVADRRLEDPELGLSVDLPAGWVSLREDNPFVVRPGARLRLAEPANGTFAALSVTSEPRLMDDLDAFLSERLQERLPRQPSQKEDARAFVQLGRGQGRLVRTSWDDGLTAMQGATVAWADGYDLFALEAWAPATAGGAFMAGVEALCRGLATRGTLAARVDAQVDALATEVPELSRDSLRLLVAERMSRGATLDDVPVAALRGISRGLDALGTAEASEMRGIYQQIWEPVPEEERMRLARLLDDIKAARPVRPDDVAMLLSAMKTGVLALPEDRRARLQELSGRAVRKSLILP
jgi:hypothetical protein